MEKKSAKNRFSIGIIGAGGIVENSHLPVLKNIDNVFVSWIYDKNNDRSVLLSTMFDVPAVEERNLKDEMGKIDICLLAIPYGARKEYIESCAALGKILYVEKPFALTSAEHKYYCDLFPVNKLAIGFQRRYYKIVEVLKSVIKSEIFGKLSSIKFKQGYFTIKGGGYLADANLSGGGVIIESGIHALDQILIMTEADSIDCTIVESLHKKGIDYDTNIASNLICSGRTVSVNCEFSTLRNLDNGLELHFEKVILKSNLFANSQIEVVEKSNKRFCFKIDQDPIPSETAQSVSESFYIFWTEFVGAIKNSNKSYTHGHSSLLTTSWIEQIYRTIRD